MVRAWYMNDSDEDQREPHYITDPPELVTLDALKEIGVLYWKVDADNIDKDKCFKDVRTERGYNYSDVISIAKDTLPNYEEKLKMFFKEHLHADEEIRLALEGSGYFDVRDEKDKWLRIELEKGDMIVLPAGIYHRFTLDNKNYIKAMRLFVGDPVWTPINRPADEHPTRVKYVQQVACN